MKFFGTLLMVAIVLGAVFLLLASLMQDLFWPAFLLLSACIALIIHMYLEISDRLDRIEQHLGIAEPKEEKTLTEQMEESKDR